MTQKKFFQIIGILFTIQLLDSTSSAYGMDEEKHWTTPPRNTQIHRQLCDSEDEIKTAKKNFEAVVICQHEGEALTVRYIGEFRIEEWEPAREQAKKFSCEPCWERYWDDKSHNLFLRKDDAYDAK